MQYHLKGFGEADPGQVLTDAINQAEQRAGLAGMFGVAMLLGVGWLVLRSTRS